MLVCACASARGGKGRAHPHDSAAHGDEAQDLDEGGGKEEVQWSGVEGS